MIFRTLLFFSALKNFLALFLVKPIVYSLVSGMVRITSYNVCYTKLLRLISGQVKFIFQPGEEGGHGAKEMIADGVLENPNVDTIVAAHVAPLIPFGTVGIYLREACASADAFYIKITGKGAHAAYPHLSQDPVLGGAHLITAIQSYNFV